MKRVLLCTPTHSLHGGMERILESMARGLPSRGFEVIFGLARGERFHDPAKFRAEYPGIPAVEMDASSGTRFGRRKAIRRAIEVTKPDVVINGRLFDVYPVCAELKLRDVQLRLAVNVQSYEAEYFVDLARWGGFVDLCVTSGELMNEAMLRFTRVAPACIRAIPGGVEPARRRVVHEPHKPLRLGYVGRIEQLQKRIRDLPAFVAQLRARNVPFTLDVVGTGSEEAWLREQLPDARFHGWLSTSELYDRIFPELDVLVHFASWEGSPIAPREAMAHGVVPVISRFPGLAEDRQFVDGENALTFAIGDVKGAADSVERLHADRGLLERLSWNAGASIQGIRSEEGALDAWADALRMAIGNPPNLDAKMPPIQRDPGALTRLHVPEAIAERLRNLAGRKFLHSDPGSEWPHWSGEPDEALMRAIDDFGRPVQSRS